MGTEENFAYKIYQLLVNGTLDSKREIWVDFPTHMKLSMYMISTHGRIYNKCEDRLMSIQYNNDGYNDVNLTTDEFIDRKKSKKKRMRKTIHVLLATVFIPNPEHKKTVDHKNNIRDSNDLYNLGWATQSEQNLSRAMHESPDTKIIFEYDENNNLIAEYASLGVMMDHLNLKNTNNANRGCKNKILFNNHYRSYKEIIALVQNEKWKKHPQIDMTVSNLGRLRSSTGKYLKLNYSRVYPRVTYKEKTLYVHQLVCTVFHGKKPSRKYVVNHKDGNKNNPSADNLEWVTHAQNNKHAVLNELTSQESRKNILSKPVAQYKDGVLIKTYNSVNDAARETNVCSSSISDVCTGERRTLYDCTWEFAEPNKNKLINPIIIKTREDLETYVKNNKNEMIIENNMNDSKKSNNVTTKQEVPQKTIPKNTNETNKSTGIMYDNLYKNDKVTMDEYGTIACKLVEMKNKLEKFAKAHHIKVVVKNHNIIHGFSDYLLYAINELEHLTNEIARSHNFTIEVEKIDDFCTVNDKIANVKSRAMFVIDEVLQ